MTTDNLLDAIGMIPDEYIQDAKSSIKARHTFSIKKTMAMVAAILICVTVSFPVLALASTNDAIYQLVYWISPPLAQQLKPVNMSCVDNGIKMEVVSAYIYEDQAKIVVSMEDIESDRIDDTIDLYDSYSIHIPFDSTGTCQQLAYDDTTGKATFLISISGWGDKDITGDKITFSLREFLSHKQTFEEEVPIDLNTVDVLTSTQKRECHYIPPFEDAETETWQEPCLIPQDDCKDFIDGIDLTGYGYIDGKFHIQIAISNRLENDNHGSFYLVDKNGEKQYCDYNVDWIETVDGTRIDYEEYIFDIPMDELGNYQIYGYFVTSEGAVKGDWQVTFPLENKF